MLFSISIFLLALGVDYLISDGLRNSGLRKYTVWNDIYKSNLDEDIIVSGSSRAWAQYDTNILEESLRLNVYNIGIDGHPIDYQLIRYNTYIRFNRKPKYIIQNIDFATLSLSNDGYEREQFFPYLKDRRLIKEVGKLKEISFFDRNIPLLRYYGYRDEIKNGLKSYFGKRDFIYEANLYKGYQGNEYSWDGSKLSEIDSIVFKPNEEAVSLFCDFLIKSKNENIQVILVSAPLYKEVLGKIVNKEVMDSTFHHIATKFDLHILDYKEDEMCLDTAYFYNGTHLNKKGAELFTSKLALDLKKIIR